MNKNIHVVVLMGGWSSEREVSLSSGQGVAEALRERGWTKSPSSTWSATSRRGSLMKPDIVFNALHGTRGRRHGPGHDGLWASATRTALHHLRGRHRQ